MSQRDALNWQLAGLAALESAVRLAIRGLNTNDPDVAHDHRRDERSETATARRLVQLAESLLLALDDHRCHLLARLLGSRPDPDQTAWPF